jgi:hypothetical protein
VGFQDPRENAGQTIPYYYRSMGFAFISGQQFKLDSYNEQVGAYKITAGPNKFEDRYNYDGVESCEEGKDQAFDPRVSKLEWQQKNPVNNQWETLGSYVKQNGIWNSVPGRITISAAGNQQETNLSQLTALILDKDLTELNGKKETYKYYWPPTNMNRGEHPWKNLPIYSVMNPELPPASNARYTQKQGVDWGVRVLRYSPNGQGGHVLQNGYSDVNLWYSGQTVKVCNSISRYRASCSFRANNLPLKLHYQGKASIKMPELTFNPTSGIKEDGTSSPFEFWNATKGVIDQYMQIYTYHPGVLEGFRCGKPNLDNILSDTALVNDLASYPKGFVNETSSIDQSNINTLAYNVAIGGVVPTKDASGNVVMEQSSPEYRALYQLNSDIEKEPYYLIQDILQKDKVEASGNKNSEGDYTKLVTAEYSFGGPVLQNFYVTNAFDLPVYPNGGGYTLPNPNVPDFSNLNFDINNRPKFTVSGWSPFKTRLLRHSGTFIHFANAQLNTTLLPRLTGNQNLLKTNELSVRPMSGILTQPAFLAPVSPKMRTISARYFTRLLCSEPKDIPYVEAVHAPYVPSIENSGSSHIQPDCRTCHINMDPLANALSANFMQPPTATLGTKTNLSPLGGWGEMLPMYHIGQGNGNLPNFGIRWGGPKGVGAFMGQEITGGVKQVGQILAASDQFSACVVKTAFENIFGRPYDSLDTAEEAMFLRIKSDFKLNGSYKKMILNIVTDPHFMKSPQSPNSSGGN